MWRKVKLKIKQWKKKILPYVAVYVAFPLLRFILWTCRTKIIGIDKYVEIAATQPTILFLWHDRLAPVIPLIATYAPQFQYAPVVSDSRDGHLISKVINRIPKGNTIDVPHDGRVRALQAIVKTLKEKKAVIVITPDGPRGPRHKAKRGTAVAAKMSEATLVPLHWEASRCWHFPSWDKMAIPKPFSDLTLIFGEPFQAHEEDETHDITDRMESSLSQLNNEKS